MRVLITGANGFVGTVLCRSLIKKSHSVRCVVRERREYLNFSKDVDIYSVGEIGPSTIWAEALRDIDIIVHLASRVHVMKDESLSPLDEYRRVNTEGTKRLAFMAALAGIQRLVYVSTVKVNGEFTHEQPFNEDDTPNPLDPYGISKWEAEVALRHISSEKGLQVTVIRPPLVYGPEVKANFLQLLDMVNKNIPLPLLLVNNKRSMIYIENLVDAIIKCIEHPKAANQTFLVSDGQDISTPDLIKMIAKAMGKKPRLLPVPSVALKVLGRITGKQSEVERLIGNLQIDSSKIRNTLDWKPSFTVEEGISETVKWYINTYEKSGGRG